MHYICKPHFYKGPPVFKHICRPRAQAWELQPTLQNTVQLRGGPNASYGLCANVKAYGVSVGDQVWVSLCHPENPVHAWGGQSAVRMRIRRQCSGIRTSLTLIPRYRAPVRERHAALKSSARQLAVCNAAKHNVNGMFIGMSQMQLHVVDRIRRRTSFNGEQYLARGTKARKAQSQHSVKYIPAHQQIECYTWATVTWLDRLARNAFVLPQNGEIRMCSAPCSTQVRANSAWTLEASATNQSASGAPTQGPLALAGTCLTSVPSSAWATRCSSRRAPAVMCRT